MLFDLNQRDHLFAANKRDARHDLNQKDTTPVAPPTRHVRSTIVKRFSVIALLILFALGCTSLNQPTQAFNHPALNHSSTTKSQHPPVGTNLTQTADAAADIQRRVPNGRATMTYPRLASKQAGLESANDTKADHAKIKSSTSLGKNSPTSNKITSENYNFSQSIANTQAIGSNEKRSHQITNNNKTTVVEKYGDTSIEVTHHPLSAKQLLLNKFRNAAKAFNQGNYDVAERLLSDVLVRDDGHHEARLLLAKLYAQQKQDNQAETTLSNALLRYPQHAPYISFYAQLLAEQGRDDVAIETLKNALPKAHDNAEIHSLIAGLYQRTGNPIAAAKNYLVALQIDPTHGEWWMGLGISSEQAGDKTTAEKAYNEALQHPLATDVKQYVDKRLQQLADNKIAIKSLDN